MPADRLRVLVPALLALAMLVAAALILDWFIIEMPVLHELGFSHLSIDLRQMHACHASGVCESSPMSIMRSNMYSTFAAVTFWSSLAFGVVVAMQVGARIFTEQVNPRFTRLGYLLGAAVFGNAFLTGYFFGPEVGGEGAMMDVGQITVTRTWAPLVMLGGAIAGMVALYYATLQESLSTAILEPVKPDLAPARVLPRKSEPPKSEPAKLERPKTLPPITERPKTIPPITERPKTVPPVANPATRESQRLAVNSTPIPVATPRTITAQPKLRGKLRFAALTAELTRGGVDAWREDGSHVLVVWRDVVGAVARRLPAELEGATFVDLVSTAGSTLRILPWTRLSGDALDGQDRSLALLHYIVARCPDILLDPATRAFIESTSDAAQLPDVATLAAHDARLA